jgi:hypothetical protein
MKNLIFHLLFLNTLFSHAQISTIQVNKSSSDEVTKMVYDSLEGEFRGDKKSDLGQLIGQELYLKPKSNSFDVQLGYKGFIKDYKISEFEKVMCIDAVHLMMGQGLINTMVLEINTIQL